MDCWEILGIEPTTDKKIIQKAYAELTKKYHYEVYPEEFKKIQEAYKMAISYTKNKKDIYEPNYKDEENIYEPKYKNKNKENNQDLKSEFNFKIIDDYNKELEKLKNDFNYIYYDNNSTNRLVEVIYSERFLTYIRVIYNFDELFKEFFDSFSDELDYSSIKKIYDAFNKVFKQNNIENKISNNILSIVSEKLKSSTIQRNFGIAKDVMLVSFVILIGIVYISLQVLSITKERKKDFEQPKRQYTKQDIDIEKMAKNLEEFRKDEIEQAIWDFYTKKYNIPFEITYNSTNEDKDGIKYYEFIVSPQIDDIDKKVILEFSVFEETKISDEEIVETDEYLRNILSTAAGRANILRKINWNDRDKYNENYVLLNYNFNKEDFILRYQTFVDIVQKSIILDGTQITTEIFTNDNSQQNVKYSFIKGEEFNLEDFKESIKDLK